MHNTVLCCCIAVLLQGQKTGGVGASEFARTKTLAEQREYLPVRQVRDDLMRVISDHQVSGHAFYNRTVLIHTLVRSVLPMYTIHLCMCAGNMLVTDAFLYLHDSCSKVNMHTSNNTYAMLLHITNGTYALHTSHELCTQHNTTGGSDSRRDRLRQNNTINTVLT
jgi:hypothetical protein